MRLVEHHAFLLATAPSPVSRSHPAWWPLLVVGLSACQAASEVRFPEVEGAQSVLLLVESGGRETGEVVAQAVGGSTSFTLAEDRPVFALFYSYSLAELQLSPGFVRAAQDEASSRSIPQPDDAFQLDAQDRASWIPVDAEASTLFRSFLLPRLSDEACADAGGCYADHPLGLCVQPCPPSPEPLPPSFGAEGPEAPELPRLLPCPPTWVEVEPETTDALTICDPFPGGRPTCAAPEAAFFGGCARVGTACPADGWPENLPQGQTVYYVREGAPPGGSGSRAAPFSTIAEALAGARPGTVVAIATGSYDEWVDLRPGVTLWGACAAQTEIHPSGLPPPGRFASVVAEQGGQMELRNLTIRRATSSTQTGSLDVIGASVQVVDLIAERVGIIEGADVEGSRWLLQSTQPDAVLVISSAAQLRLDDLAIDLDAEWPQSVVLHGEVTSATVSRASIQGAEILVLDGAHLSLDQALVEESRASGVALFHSTARVANTVVRGTGHELGHAFFVESGSLDLERISVLGPDTYAIEGHASDLSLRDVFMERIGIDERFGAIHVLTGSFLDGTRVYLSHSSATGVRQGFLVNDECTEPGDVVMSDLVVSSAEYQSPPGASFLGGQGIDLPCGGRLELTRALLEDNDEVAINADRGAMIDLLDVTLRGSLGRSDEVEGGDGITLSDEAHANLTRVLIEDNRGIGLEADRGSELNLVDVWVRNQGREGICLDGAGEEQMTTASLERVRISDADGGGLVIGGSSTVPEATDLIIERTGRAVRDIECKGLSCSGNGIVVQHRSQSSPSFLNVSRFSISESEDSGLAVIGFAAVYSTEGVISGSGSFGVLLANQQTTADFMNRVHFEDNGGSFSSQE